MRKKILGVEPEPSGHHFSLYLKNIVDGLRDECALHLLTTKSAVLHEAFYLSGLNKQQLIVHYMSGAGLIKRGNWLRVLLDQIKVYAEIRKCFKHLNQVHNFDLVIVPCLDHFEKALAIFGSPFSKTKYIGILISVKFFQADLKIRQEIKNDKYLKYLFYRILCQAQLSALFITDEILYEHLFREKKAAQLEKIKYLPEPCELKDSEFLGSSKFDLGIPDIKKVILVYGDLSSRKGICELLDCIAINSNVIVILAGILQSSIKKILESDRPQKLIFADNLRVYPGFHSSEQSDIFFRSADIVWVAYTEGFIGSSGVYFQAAAYGIPVISSNIGLLSWLVQKNKNGITVDVANKDSIAQGIELLCSNQSLARSLSKGGIELSKKHSSSIFASIISKTVEVTI
jgi:glycosyltransferase involved in cell wall biosynthesis